MMSLNIGQRVRITENGGLGRWAIGLTGVVTAVYPEPGLFGKWDYAVRLDSDPGSEAMCVMADEIEPLDATSRIEAVVERLGDRLPDLPAGL